jgi:hypothetical protein
MFKLDYDAPLSETGDYTDKYEAIVRLINSALAVRTRLPQRPAEMPKKAYDSIEIDSYLSFTDMLDQVVSTLSNFKLFEYNYRPAVFFKSHRI